MIVRTKKYQLPTKKYIGIAFNAAVKQQWWVFLIYAAICSGYFLAPNHWWITGATIALGLYLLFWLIQFAGITQLEQGKFMFEKLSYEKDQYVLDQRIIRLESEINRDNQIYSTLKSTESNTSDPVHQDIQTLNALKEEKTLETKKYESQIRQIETRFASDLLRLDLENQRLESELEVLYIEKETLTQLAPFSGTIGSISVQLNELVPPYETIISIYDESPNIIKAYMNERMRLSINPGDTVMVESINRQYKIQGDVIEVGSRIVSYPKQMIGMGQQNMWGREIFIRIPRENEFLNGEKVYVILDSF